MGQRRQDRPDFWLDVRVGLMLRDLLGVQWESACGHFYGVVAY